MWFPPRDFDHVRMFHALTHFDQGAMHSIDRSMIAATAPLEAVDDIAGPAFVNRQS
jgi:hypothetical protein